MRPSLFIAGLREQSNKLFPRCNDSSCGGRGTWWQLYWRKAGVRLNRQWYCSPQCFERAARQSFVRALANSASSRPVRHRVPLGLLMLSRGQLTNRQLRLALDAQRNGGRGRIGHWLQQLGFATEQQVTAALGMQWSCPIFAQPEPGDFTCLGLLPFPLMESFRMLPIHFVAATQSLYLAFCEGIEYAALCAIEHILGCHTEACLVGDSVLNAGLQRFEPARRRGELVFESCRQAAEMARIACSYALKLGAGEVRLAPCGPFMWVRLEHTEGHTDLLFRTHPAGLRTGLGHAMPPLSLQESS